MRVRGHEPGLVGQDDGLDPVAQGELGQHPADVGLHGALLDHELSGDLGIRQATCDEPEHVHFTSGQLGGDLRRRRRGPDLPGEAGDQPPGDARVGSHRLLAANLRVRAFELESERAQFAAETVRYGRARIARELHDVIAHSVSIMVIQASAGQRLTPDDPAAGELRANIAEQAREATADISGLTCLLNPALEHPVTQEHLEDLLVRTAQTGVQLDFDIVGDVGSIPGQAARATYRILQEGSRRHHPRRSGPGGRMAAQRRAPGHHMSNRLAGARFGVTVVRHRPRP